MILRLVIADGSQSPAVSESVELADDGTIHGWRSVSAAGVGWFAGRLPSLELSEVKSLIAAAGPPPQAMSRPGAAEEVLELPATGPVSIAGITDGPGGWAALAAASRQLIERLTDFPQATVTLAVPPTSNRARLVHRGADPLRVDLRHVAVRATSWRGYYEPAGDWAGGIDGPGEVEAGPGWEFEVPFEAGPADAVTHLAVDFAIMSGATRVPVRARYTPAPGGDQK